MDTEPGYTLVEKKNHVTWSTMNRPGARDALTSRCRAELRAAFEESRSDDDAWVAVLTGVGGKAFCTGADPKGAARNFAAVTERQHATQGGVVAEFRGSPAAFEGTRGFAGKRPRRWAGR